MSYERQIAQATRMIAAKGQSVLWRKTAVTTNAQQPWKSSTAGAPVDKPVTIAFFNQVKELRNGTDVVTSRSYGLMAAVDFTPQMTDVVVRAGETLIVLDIEVLAPDGTPILYTVRFK